MRELKAGLGLVFDTLIGWLYFFFVLLMWIFVMFFSLMSDSVEFTKTIPIFWFWMIWPVSTGASQLAQGYKSVLSCGGLYCVPRLRTGMKRFAIISGFILALMFTLPWFLIKGLTLRDTYICMAISFTLLAAYFTGVSIPWPTTSKKTVSSVIWVLWVAIFLRLFLALYPGISLLEGWPAILAAGIFLCLIYCGPYKNKQIQSAHRQLAGSTTDINEKPQQAKLQITPNVERFFIGKLNRCSQKTRYLWGAIYPCLGTLLSCSKRTVSFAFALAILSGFLPRPSSMIIMFVVIMIVISGIGLYIKLPVHSQMLIAGGRRERCYGAIAAAISFSIALGLMFALIAAISQLIAPIIPPFVFRGQMVTFTPLSLYPAFITIGIIPAIFGLSLCFERAPFLTGFIIILLAIPALAFLFSIAPMTFRPVPITLLVISCWAFLVFVLRSICYGKDLILQTDKI